jgi:hypothetical protein
MRKLLIPLSLVLITLKSNAQTFIYNKVTCEVVKDSSEVTTCDQVGIITIKDGMVYIDDEVYWIHERSAKLWKCVKLTTAEKVNIIPGEIDGKRTYLLHKKGEKRFYYSAKPE